MKATVPYTFVPQHFFQKVSKLPLPKLADKKKRMVWVSSNCRPTQTYGRDKVVEGLMELDPEIEARGACLNNAPRFEGGGDVLLEGYGEYKFALVMENSVELDWATEKF